VLGVTCSMASTNILWVQECFSSEAPEFATIARLAERWNAAVELLRLASPSGPEPSADAASSPAAAAAADSPPEARRAENGWIEDDVPEAPTGMIGCDDEGLREVCEELRRRGVGASMRTAVARPRVVSMTIDRTVPYSLVIVGRLFSGKGRAAGQRMTRELSGQLSDTLRVPVVDVQDIVSQYMMQGRRWVQQVAFAVVVALLYLYVFTHQETVLKLLVPEGSVARMLASAVVLVIVPTVALLYGTLARNVLRLLKIE
jgi:hypothetical protein